MGTVQIEFEPIGRRGKCATTQSMLQCAQQLGIGIVNICGGIGKCAGCKIQLIDGECSELTSIEREKLGLEELQQGYRLACQAYPLEDCKVRVPLESMSSPQRTQVDGREVQIDLDPSIGTYQLKIVAPSLVDLEGDAERVLAAMEEQHGLHLHWIDVDVLRKASNQLRSWQWETEASVRNDEIIALRKANTRHLGLAVDLGTTKIAAYLVDLKTGQTLASMGAMNPQISCGEDVVTRISFSMESDDNLKKIRSILVKELNRMIRELCNKSQVSPEEIDEAVVVGNTAMHHLFLGLPVTQLARVPFVPALRQAFDIKARDAGINIAAGAYIHLLPNIAGFVGADHVAMIMATGIRQYEGVTLAVDVGTNTEICLVADGKTTSVSCASGPAFEGGHIKDGMRAARGAIERLYIQNGNVFYHTVGNAKPAGICGSGIIDTLGQLVLNNVVDESGRMDTDYSNVRSDDGQREFLIVDEKERRGAPAISITQHDIRELQMAKAAIQVGIQTLLKNSDHEAEDIDKVVIAGAFGSYIDVGNAIAIGMLPSLPIDRFEQVGNAAGMGAKLALLSLQKRAEAQAIAYSTEYIELATTQDFMQNFVDATYLKPYT